jgi:3'-phosphoadenosine 5'-phosphosulfate sulfotransferase (PAPS reductase)/FAD synthetase
MQDLYQMQGLPLELKIRMTKSRIRDWINAYGEDGVYVSFSGGKDSTVLLDLVRQDYPNIPAVFVDTGLEYPEIRQFVKTFDNVEWLKPKMNFKQVIQKYGYPFISKEVSECVYGARKYLTQVIAESSLDRPTDRYRTSIGTRELEVLANILNDRMVNRKGGQNQRLAIMLGMLTKDKNHPIKENIPENDRSQFSQEKYSFFLDAPFEISNKCCNVMKKEPAHRYQKQTGRNPMTAQMASESRLRAQKWLQNGCNGFDLKSPISNPMAFWTEQDVLLYIYTKHLPICSVYGDIVKDSGDGVEGQMDLEDVYGKELFDLGKPKLKTTGCNRTGCVFCGYGCHLEKPGEGRFERMKVTHPTLYEYVFNDGIFKYTIKDRHGNEIKIKDRHRDMLVRWIKQNENNQNFTITKQYIPGVGLGYKYVIDWINENGNLNIKY